MTWAFCRNGVLSLSWLQTHQNGVLFWEGFFYWKLPWNDLFKFINELVFENNTLQLWNCVSTALKTLLCMAIACPMPVMNRKVANFSSTVTFALDFRSPSDTSKARILRNLVGSILNISWNLLTLPIITSSNHSCPESDAVRQGCFSHRLAWYHNAGASMQKKSSSMTKLNQNMIAKRRRAFESVKRSQNGGPSSV